MEQRGDQMGMSSKVWVYYEGYSEGSYLSITPGNWSFAKGGVATENRENFKELKLLNKGILSLLSCLLCLGIPGSCVPALSNSPTWLRAMLDTTQWAGGL